MWPRKIPRDVLANQRLGTECMVYEKLRDELDDSFVVYHSSPWIGVNQQGQEIDGECDFVVAHPDLGLLALEVKGGQINYDPKTKQWTSKDRYGCEHSIKDPVNQASTSKHKLVEKLKRFRTMKSVFIHTRHGVILPHAAKPPRDLGADKPLELFCFASEYTQNLGNWVVKRFGTKSPNQKSGNSFGKRGLKALEMLLAQPFQLQAPLGSYLSEDDREINTLTQEQFEILNNISEISQVAIQGAAGTGKTLLAIEEAYRQASNGARTLFVCFNRGLAASVKSKFGNSLPITVKTFLQLGYHIAKEAGLTELYDFEKMAKDDYFENLPIVMLEAFEKLPNERFDVVIVDEGQDFRDEWWEVLDCIMRPDGPNRVRIFFDNNQKIYSFGAKLPKSISLSPIQLTKNMRNTQKIHKVVRHYYQGLQVESVGPEGTEVEWITVESQQQIQPTVVEILNRLVTNEKIEASDIAILSPKYKDISEYFDEKKIGPFERTNCEKPLENKVVVDSVSRFKGLDSSVLVLIATEYLIEKSELVYVGMTRARTHLIIVGTKDVLKKLKQASFKNADSN